MLAPGSRRKSTTNESSAWESLGEPGVGLVGRSRWYGRHMDQNSWNHKAGLECLVTLLEDSIKGLGWLGA